MGEAAEGFLVTTQHSHKLPFAIKRVFWVYDTPASVVRGQHAHVHTEMVLLCLQGTATIEVEDVEGNKETFTLAQPNAGLFLPTLHWSKIYLQPTSVLLCLASTDFAEEDYIRDYQVFKQGKIR
nr:FdtA/QdtA family cupin domain-containing protein [Rufibacter sp. LB8]